MLNQNTYFVLTEINHHFETASCCHILYGDGKLEGEFHGSRLTAGGRPAVINRSRWRCVIFVVFPVLVVLLVVAGGGGAAVRPINPLLLTKQTNTSLSI